jgi:hypothetical protein
MTSWKDNVSGRDPLTAHSLRPIQEERPKRHKVKPACIYGDEWINALKTT